jgi:mannose/fructose/N-acetylgalactosamine-specific phosphotransferase system component IIC
MLPAIGVAMLLQKTIRQGSAVFFILGFSLVAFLKLNSVGVTVFGVIVAIIYFQASGKKETASTMEEDI